MERSANEKAASKPEDSSPPLPILIVLNSSDSDNLHAIVLLRSRIFQVCLRVFNYAEADRVRNIAPAQVVLDLLESVGILIACFRSSIHSPPVPLFTLRPASLN
jgi:hypothetical protein